MNSQSDRRRFLNQSATTVLALGACLSGCSGRNRAPAGMTYTVQKGDTLTILARRSGLTITQICVANDLHKAQLTPGQRLVLPGVSRLDGDIRRDYDSSYKRQDPRHIAGLPVVQRHQWGAMKSGNNFDAMPGINRITLHHTAMDGYDSISDVAMVRLIQERHQAKGWADIGYHYIIGYDGRIFAGRPESVQGAHAGGERNRYNLGVALRGNFMRQRPTEAQLRSLAKVLQSKQRSRGVPLSRVYGHRDLDSTLCPGDRLYRWLDQYRRA